MTPGTASTFIHQAQRRGDGQESEINNYSQRWDYLLQLFIHLHLSANEYNRVRKIYKLVDCRVNKFYVGSTSNQLRFGFKKGQTQRTKCNKCYSRLTIVQFVYVHTSIQIMLKVVTSFHKATFKSQYSRHVYCRYLN